MVRNERLEKAIKQLYLDKCTIYEYTKETDEETHLTREYEKLLSRIYLVAWCIKRMIHQN